MGKGRRRTAGFRSRRSPKNPVPPSFSAQSTGIAVADRVGTAFNKFKLNKKLAEEDGGTGDKAKCVEGCRASVLGRASAAAVCVSAAVAFAPVRPPSPARPHPPSSAPRFIIFKITGGKFEEPKGQNEQIDIDVVSAPMKGEDGEPVFDAAWAAMTGGEGADPQCRYALLDIQTKNKEGRLSNKLVFLSWVPEYAKAGCKMLYAGSMGAMRAALPGVSIALSGNDPGDVTWQMVYDKCDKGF